MRFIIKGQCKSGKNSMQVSRNGRHYPLPAFVKWRSDVEAQIMAQGEAKRRFIGPCTAYFWYVPGDLKRRDVPGMIDALFHVLERLGIVEDDSLIENVVWKRWEMDRKNPRIEVELLQ